jgi:hypothetical protein
MAIDFLIDGAQSAGTIAQNIFNKASNAYTGAKNFGSIAGTFGDSLIGPKQGGWDSNLMSSGMREEIMNQAYSDMQKYGKADGGIGYGELGLPSYWDRTGEHPKGLGQGGLFSAKNAVALTGGKMDYSVNPQSGMLSITGGADYNFPEGIFGDNKVSTGVADWINKGGTQWNPQGIQLDPARIKKELNNYSMGSADRHYDKNQVIPKPIDVDYNSTEYWKDYWKETPYDTLSEPPVRIRPETFPTQPTSTPVGTSATALAQIQANIEAAKMKEESPNGGSINQTKKTTATSGMMSSGGPPRRGSMRGRKKTVTKPSKSSYGRRYGL